MEYEEFESELGDVAVTRDHIERESRESEDWEKISENFSSEELVDKIHFSKIEELKYQPESIFPYILFKVDGAWKRMFFRDGDRSEECFKLLEYRWKAFRQIYR